MRPDSVAAAMIGSEIGAVRRVFVYLVSSPPKQTSAQCWKKGSNGHIVEVHARRCRASMEAVATLQRMAGPGILLPDVAALQEMERDLLLRPFALHATMAVETRRRDF